MSTVEAPKVDLSLTDAELSVLRHKYERLTDEEFSAFLAAAHRYRLNPLANQIYARLQEKTQRNPRSVTYMAQIDGYRLLADRTGCYAGNDDPAFDNETKPTKASVTVYKLVGGQARPFTASARMAQYKPAGNAGFMWDRMPHLMLGKCAEALALRKAFPAELGGLYTIEEMEQAGEPETDAPATLPMNKPAPETPPPTTSEPAQQPEKRKLDLRKWDTEKILKLTAAAETYEQLLLVLDGCTDGDAWADVDQREWILKGLGERYRALIAKELADVPAVTKAFIEKMKAHKEKLDLDKQFKELEDQMDAEAKAKAEAAP